MGSRRTKRSEMPRDPAGTIRVLRTCRQFLTTYVMSETRAFGPTYTLARNIVTTIDALAEHVSGEKDYFMIGGSSANAARLEAEAKKAARERGDIPCES